MRASDYEAVIQIHPDLKVNGIKVYHDVSELAQDYQANPHSCIFYELPSSQQRLLMNYKLPDSICQILHDFGHTDQEILDYEKSKNTEILQKRNESQFLKNFIKIARGIWHDFNRGPLHLEELREYLDNCGITYDWSPG
jgi:hypothetical protein